MAAIHPAHSRFAFVSTLAVIATLTTPAYAAARPGPSTERVVGHCNPAKTKFVLSSRITSTKSLTATNIAELAFRFVQQDAGCVLVDFSAAFHVVSATAMIVVQPVIKRSDGVALENRPQSVSFPSNADYIPRTAKFVFPDVPPGQYIIRMQMRNGTANGAIVEVAEPTMVIHYN